MSHEVHTALSEPDRPPDCGDPLPGLGTAGFALGVFGLATCWLFPFGPMSGRAGWCSGLRVVGGQSPRAGGGRDRPVGAADGTGVLLAIRDVGPADGVVNRTEAA